MKAFRAAKSDYATFHAFAGDHCSVAQVYKGQCQLNWKLKPKTLGLSEEQRELIRKPTTAFRVKLEGKEGKGWETVKVLATGRRTMFRKLSRHRRVNSVRSSKRPK